MSAKLDFIKDLVAKHGQDVVDRIKSVLPDDATVKHWRDAAESLVGTASNAPPAKKAVSATKKSTNNLTVPVGAPNIVKRVSGAEKRAASGAGYSREDIAQRYPEVAEPVLTVYKDSGKEGLTKGKSLEAEAVSKDLARITASMKDEGYTPYFNPADRYYVNPNDYPLVGDTLNIRPARDDTLAKYEELANDPDAMDRLRAAYARGSEHPDAKQWYAMGQLEDAFKSGLGVDEGRNMFKDRFAHAMAATTGGMDPAANFRLAHFMNYLAKNGQPTPIAAWQLPYPIGGGKYGVQSNIAQYENILNRGNGLGVANPKRFNFSGDFLGHLNKATLDEQMLSGGWDPKMKAPPSNTYGVYEGALGKLAKEFGVPPAEVQDVMWAGLKLPKDKSYTPRPMIDIVNDAIERTSRLTGLSPEDVVHEGIVKAERPIFAKGGGVDAERLVRKYG